MNFTSDQLALLLISYFLISAVTATAADPEKLSKSSVNSPRYQYMQKLQSSLLLTKENGMEPTSVFCLADYDVLGNRSRPEFSSSVYPTRCSSTHRFYFEWDSGDVNRSLPLTDAYLRVYAQLIERNIPKGTSVPVSISAHIGLSESVADIDTPDSDFNETTMSFVTNIYIDSTQSDQWIEVNITQELRKVWDQVTNNNSIDITLRFSVDCSKFKRVLKIVNPATIEHSPKRERLLDQQPMFIVYIDDINVKNLRMIPVAENVSAVSLEETVGDEEQLEEERRKRQVPHDQHQVPHGQPICDVKDFDLNFHDIGLTNIILPKSLNVRQCAGGCSFFHLQRASTNLATNHARLVASAHAKSLAADKPDLPCCSPAEYSDWYLTMRIGQKDLIETRLHTNLVVKRCACR